MFPYLPPAATKDHSQLQERLYDQTNQIKMSFTSLLFDSKQSLESEGKLDDVIDMLVLYDESYESVFSDCINLSQVFRKMRKYVSFFDYELVKLIVDELGSSILKQKLTSYIKQFEEETNLNCYLLLDTSESMLHPTDTEPEPADTRGAEQSGASQPRLTKLRYSSYLIASLAYFMAKQRDAVGFAYFDAALHQYLPARSSTAHLHSILLTLETLQTTKNTRMGTPLHQIAERLTKRGLVLFISDLYDENPEEVIAGLEHLRYEGHEVIVFHVLAQQELAFANFETGRSSEALIRFIDSETDAEIITTPQAIRESYLSNFNAFLDIYKRALRQADIDYNIITTTTPIDLALAAYLAKRQGIF